MKKRTYKEAVDLMVKWWSKKSFKTALNQNNGDSGNGGIAFLLMNMVSTNAQNDISEEKIKKFEEKLTEILLDGEDKGRWKRECDVDYNPNKILADACEFAEINSGCLPCKTFTYINNDNEVEGRYQYGGEWFKL